MHDLIDALYSYLEEHRMPALLKTPDYRCGRRRLETDWDNFCALLTAEQVRRLEALRMQEATVRHTEDLAMFRAALSMGQELARL